MNELERSSASWCHRFITHRSSEEWDKYDVWLVWHSVELVTPELVTPELVTFKHLAQYGAVVLWMASRVIQCIMSEIIDNMLHTLWLTNCTENTRNGMKTEPPKIESTVLDSDMTPNDWCVKWSDWPQSSNMCGLVCCCLVIDLPAAEGLVGLDQRPGSYHSWTTVHQVDTRSGLRVSRKGGSNTSLCTLSLSL